MRHNYSKAKGETIDIFAYGENLNTFKLFKITDTSVMTDITPATYTIELVVGDLYKVSVTLPNEDVILCSVLNGNPLFLRVGDPIVRYCAYSETTGDIIPYTRYDTVGNIIENGDLDEYGYGIYGYVPSNSAYSIIKSNGHVDTLAVPYNIGNLVNDTGTIKLERGVWQLIAIPIYKNVYDGFLEKLAVDNGVQQNDLVELVTAYRGDQNKFLSFVPGVTNYNSEHNFTLMHNDDGNTEITAFWVKCKEWTHTQNDIVFVWDSN